jgi:hypothetical protein
LLAGSKETGLEMNADKNKYMVVSRGQNAGRSNSVKLIIFGNYLNRSKFYSEEIESRLKSGDLCCHSMQNPLSSSLPAKNLKNNIYRTIILPVVLYGCETWSFTLREGRRLSVL